MKSIFGNWGKAWNFFGEKFGTCLGKSSELVWGKVWSFFGKKLGMFLVKDLELCWRILSTLWNSEGTSLASLGKWREFNFVQQKIYGISTASKLLADKYYTPNTNTP